MLEEELFITVVCIQCPGRMDELSSYSSSPFEPVCDVYAILELEA